MNSTLNNTRKMIAGIVAIASLGVASAAYSQAPAPGTGMGPMGGMYPPQGMPGAAGPGAHFDPAAMLDGRMAYVKSALKITSAQEGYWDAYSAKVKEQAQAMKAARTTAAQNAPLAAPDRIAKQLAAMQQTLDNMNSNVLPAMRNLYGSLTAEQKAVADKILGKPGRGFGRHGR